MLRPRPQVVHYMHEGSAPPMTERDRRLFGSIAEQARSSRAAETDAVETICEPRPKP